MPFVPIDFPLEWKEEVPQEVKEAARPPRKWDPMYEAMAKLITMNPGSAFLMIAPDKTAAERAKGQAGHWLKAHGLSAKDHPKFTIAVYKIPEKDSDRYEVWFEKIELKQ